MHDQNKKMKLKYLRKPMETIRRMNKVQTVSREKPFIK